MCEFIYLVSKQSSFFGFSSFSNQYWSYESRSAPVLAPALSSSISVSLTRSFPLFARALFIFVSFSLFLSFFSCSVLVVCLFLSLYPFEKLLCPSGRSPVTLLVLVKQWLKIDQNRESELDFSLWHPLVPPPPHPLNYIDFCWKCIENRIQKVSVCVHYPQLFCMDTRMTSTSNRFSLGVIVLEKQHSQALWTRLFGCVRKYLFIGGPGVSGRACSTYQVCVSASPVGLF